jgi:hypothetical protein
MHSKFVFSDLHFKYDCLLGIIIDLIIHCGIDSQCDRCLPHPPVVPELVKSEFSH